MPTTGRVGLDAAIFSNVFQPKFPTGPIAANAASERLGQGGHPLRTLSRAVGAGIVGMVDSIDISPAARVAAAVA
ncbi:MAG: hypothetical protein KGJ86_23405, partial [Chloroflexota bacterium]|nr:hypothetical protein [Chloroflexota bacterium]